MKTHILLLAISCAVSVNARAETPARMRYNVALKAANLKLTDIGGVKTQSIYLSTRSQLPDVSPNDIKITLQTGDGEVSIPLDADGKFVLPVTVALRKENPWIVANQPRGSMVMKASVNIRMRVSPELHDGTWRVRYSTLFPFHTAIERIDAVTEAISADHDVRSSLTVPKSVALSCVDEQATAKLIVGDDEREIPSPTNGDFFVSFNAELMNRDAWIAVEPARGWTVTPEFENRHSEFKKAEP